MPPGNGGGEGGGLPRANSSPFQAGMPGAIPGEQVYQRRRRPREGTENPGKRVGAEEGGGADSHHSQNRNTFTAPEGGAPGAEEEASWGMPGMGNHPPVQEGPRGGGGWGYLPQPAWGMYPAGAQAGEVTGHRASATTIPPLWAWQGVPVSCRAPRTTEPRNWSTGDYEAWRHPEGWEGPAGGSMEELAPGQRADKGLAGTGFRLGRTMEEEDGTKARHHPGRGHSEDGWTLRPGPIDGKEYLSGAGPQATRRWKCRDPSPGKQARAHRSRHTSPIWKPLPHDGGKTAFQ